MLYYYIIIILIRIRRIRQPDNEMKPDFLNEMYRWALECISKINV